MSDSVLTRRQPPSPLIFSPDTVLPPITVQQSSQDSKQKHGSGSNTVSMPFIRRHVTRRLKAAKQECDKDLHRVTNAITTFFEEKLREGEMDHDQSDAEVSRETLLYNLSDNRSSVPTDEASSDGGYDAEFEGARHSRQRASPTDELSSSLTRWSSSPGLLAASLSSSPASLRRQSTLPKDKGPIPIAQSSSSSALSPSDSSPRRGGGNNGSTSAWATQGRASRRLSRSIHIPMRVSRSGQSSRSTSRSRSPLPGNHNSFDHSAVSRSPNRRASRILVDDPVDPIMTTLYEIIGVATDITEMTIAQITAQPDVCSHLVQRVQQIGKAWDEHPEWQGRNWYVQVLLAVASLSRVVEWWEAEKQFWNFDDDDDDDEQAEPFAFLLRPSDEAVSSLHSPLSRDADVKHLSLDPATSDSRPRLSRLTSHASPPREETRKLSGVIEADAEVARPLARNPEATESARVLATERLRLQAEQAQNQNIVMELSLDGEHFAWINYAWAVVVGTEPEEMFGTPISQVLAPADWNVFRNATQQLLSDDSHTIEVRFRLQIQPQSGSTSRGILYREMEGKGMLMLDQMDGRPSHTMWVVKPIGSPAYDQSQSILDAAEKVGEGKDTESDDTAEDDSVAQIPLPRPLSQAAILCRICECNIPDWFFEKHNETCSDVHKFEADIAECNESIAELRNTIREIRSAVDQSSSSTVPEYRGMPILSPPASSSSPLHIFRPPLVSKMQRMGVKRMQRRLLEQLDDILQIALEVSVPSLKEEESKEPIERQRLLSPSSERKILQVRNWSRPSSEDPALQRLISDTETLMRTKMDNVTRMQNTIRYSEKVRQEWEEKFELTLASQELEDGEEQEGDDGDDDNDSTTSEYAFNGETAPSEPTPVASSGPTPLASSSPAPSSSSGSSVRSPLAAPVPAVPSSYQGSTNYYTRSSTPSSITSPLALAEPIVASSDDAESPPRPTSPEERLNTIGRRKSYQILEPKLTVTPPISPHIVARDSNTNGNGNGNMRHRRLSTVNTLVSPGSAGPLSPRIPSVAPTKSSPTTIKDFEIIKPISKGAFGSVFLSKKRATGDYYAIKVLRKADMIAKNQITNIKAERMILMNQAESPFVAKLYFTFQSKENLYLVMEYLNGGDCAALIKSLGCLPEEWTKNYIAEVVLGLEYLHQRGIVHRDLKPDNLLIDQHGHLKLTDFGLSRIGLLGRQTRDTQYTTSTERLRPRTRYSPGSRPPSMDSAYLSSPLLSAADILGGSYFTQGAGSHVYSATSPHPSGTPTDDVSDTSGSDQFSGFFLRRSGKLNESPLQSFASELTNDLRSYNAPGLGTPPGEQKFVGTPDYLAPESILGISGDDAAVDWWALGVITYEFLYGFPPFHAETPEKVFENILSGRIEWHEEYIDFSTEAWEFMKRLLTVDASVRLGANGAEEVKNHPFFQGIDWEAVTKSEAAFIPEVTDPESTDYFDLRGASTQLFHDDEAIPIGESVTTPGVPDVGASVVGPVPIVKERSQSPSTGVDDFGSFSFKNLPVLKQANDDVIRKLKTDQLAPMVHTLSEPAQIGRPHRRSVSQKIKKPPAVVTSIEANKLPNTNPPSPATSVSSVASSPSRGSMPPSTPANQSHSRKPSEFNAIERFKQSHFDADGPRRNSMPSRLRTASVSTSGDGSGSEHWPASISHASSHFESSTPPSSNGSLDLRRPIEPSDRALTCLLAEDNPITAKIIETLLIRLGCRVVVVADGSEAISVAHGDIKFDCILMDLQMPVVDGESAARHIKSTTNRNSTVPIIAVSAYGGSDNSANTVFAASLSKPVSKADLLAVMRQQGFKTSSQQDGKTAPTRVVANR